MTAPILDPDKALLTAAWRGGPEAVEALLRSLADLVWTACRRVTRDDADAQAAFREVMAAIAANGFARLKDYDGRARVRVYVALVVRDLLLERAIKLLVLDAPRSGRTARMPTRRSAKRCWTTICGGCAPIRDAAARRASCCRSSRIWWWISCARSFRAAAFRPRSPASRRSTNRCSAFSIGNGLLPIRRSCACIS